MTKPTAAPSTRSAPTAGMRPMRIGARAVGAFVPQLTKKAFEKYGFSMASLLLDWPKIAGAALARDTIPERLKWPRLRDEAGEAGDASMRPGATLVVKVDPARALDVQYGAAQLTERINAYFGYRAVAEVRIVQGAVGEAAPAPIARSPEPTAAPATDALAGVADEGLRAALARMAAGIGRSSGAAQR